MNLKKQGSEDSSDEEDEDEERPDEEPKVKIEEEEEERKERNQLQIDSNEGFRSVEEPSASGRVLRSGRELSNIAKVVTWADFAEANMALFSNPMSDEKDEKTEPKSFQEAWWHEDLEEREKWRAAIRKEFHDMIRRGVWKKRSRAGVQNGRTTVKYK